MHISAAAIVENELFDQAQLSGRQLHDLQDGEHLVDNLEFDDMDLADIGDALRKKLHIALPVPLRARTVGALIQDCCRLTGELEGMAHAS